MNREIKFRVWDSSPEKDGFTGLMINHDYVIQSDYLIDAINGKYPIMQFTGLTDKNGKEIYEGDVIKFYTGNYYNGTLEEVVFSEGGAWFPFNNPEYTEDEQGDWFDHKKGFEIIGNIHENPELINP